MLDYNLKYLFFNFNKRKNMSCPDLGSSSSRTPKNTNPDFKHNNTCPDFLAFSCPFLSTKYKLKSISSKNTNTNLAMNLLRFSQTTKPRYTKIITQTQIFSSFNQQRNLQQIKFINPGTKFINP